MSDLPRACGFLALFFPIVSLFPQFLLLLNQFLQKYSVKECIKYFKRERLRFVHLQLFLFYIFGGMCRYRIQGRKSFSVQNCDFFFCSPDLLFLMLLFCSLMPFWWLILNRLSFLFFWKLLESSVYISILKFHDDIVVLS